MLLVTAALYPLAWDGRLSRGDGVILLFALAGYLIFVFQSVETEAPEIVGEYEEFMRTTGPGEKKVRAMDVVLVVAGCGGLVLGGYAIVEGAVAVGSLLGVSQVVIGLTVVAVGTSLPELATSLVAAMHKEADIAVGNVIGSNIFNIVAILGTATVVQPLTVAPSVLVRELPAVLGLSIVVFPMLRTGWRIKRWEGALLLACYLGIGVWLL
jgi:cation:H+ antiporter